MSKPTTQVGTYIPLTRLGRELIDIHALCLAAGMDKRQIHAAMLGRIGVCATAWGDPYSESHSRKSSGAAKGEES